MRVATMRALAMSRMPCTSITAPAVSAVRPPARLESNTVLRVTSTVWPSTLTVAATVSMMPTGPTISLPRRMRKAWAVAAARLTSPPSTSTIMPSLRSPRLLELPSSSLTLAELSSKRTPPTITEPKPLMAPWV